MRELAQLVAEAALHLGLERALHLGELEGQQVHHGHLGHVGLGSGHADLEARAREDHAVGVARGLAAHHVGHADHLGAALTRQAHGRERVRGLARLRDAHHQVVLVDHRIAVAELGGDVDLHVHPRPRLDGVAAHEPGVVGGAAGHEHDAAQVAQLVVVMPMSPSSTSSPTSRSATVSATASACSWISLSMKRLEAVLLGSVLVPVDLVNVALDGLALGVDEAGALGGHGHDLAVVHELNVAGLCQEGGDRGGDEALALAHSHHQRALLPGAHEHLRLIGGHGHEGVVAAKVVVGEADGLDEIALEVLRHEMGHHLGVGLGGERGPVSTSLSRSSVQFSTMPLSTMCTRSEVSQCGWAFASVTRPWVAQRVCPMPVEPRRWPFFETTASRRC